MDRSASSAAKQDPSQDATTAGQVFVEHLMAAMTLRGYSQSDLSEKAGISTSQISLMLSGARANPSMDILVKLALALNVSTDYLVGLPEREYHLAPEEETFVGCLRRIIQPEVRQMLLNLCEFHARLAQAS